MKYKVINNFLENNLCSFLENYLLKTPHFYGHFSKPGDPLFYYIPLDIENPIINYICFNLANKLQKNINVLRVYANVQFTNMKGEFHQDDGETTFLLMVSKTLEKNSGQFQIKINNTIESIDFQQNKLIYFQSKLFHRGLDPKEHGIPRITLVFKTGNILE